MKKILAFIVVNIFIISCNVYELAGVIDGKIDPKTFDNPNYVNDLVFTHSGNFFIGKTTNSNSLNTYLYVRNDSTDTIEILGGTINATEVDFMSATVFPGTTGTCTLNLMLAKGDSCSVAFEFTPTMVSYYDGTFTIDYQKVSEQKALSKTTNLEGQGVDRIFTPATASIDFGSVITSNSVTNIVNLSYTGTGSAVPGTSIFPSSFDYNGGGYPGTGGTCGNPITSGCALDLRFSPAATGSYSGKYSFTYDNGLFIDKFEIDLQGIGAGPAALSASPSSLAYGAVATGATIDVLITISNTGGTTATAMNGSGLAAPYSFTGGSYPGSSGDCGATLNAGTSCNIQVRYAPSAPSGGDNDTVVINYNDGAGAQNLNISVSGSANTPAVLTLTESDPYDFGVRANGSTVTHTFTVNNVGGSAASSISEIGLAAPFSRVGGTCGTN